MMIMTTDRYVRLTDAPAEVVARLKARTTYANPASANSAFYTVNGKPVPWIPTEIRVWTETADGDLCLPRGMAREISAMLPAHEVRVDTVMRKTDLHTSGALVPRPYQTEAVDAILRAKSGVIVAPTGTGKTVIACSLIERLQTHALMLVHTRTLLDQTVARIREHLGIEPGIIGDGVFDPRPVTVGMVQTLARHTADEPVDAAGCRLGDYFGLVIQDEAHHVPAETFARVISMFGARYRVGLTATPERADGLTQILYDMIGPVVYRLGAVSLPLRAIQVPTAYRVAITPMRTAGGVTRADIVRLMRMTTGNDSRTAWIVRHIMSHEATLSGEGKGRVASLVITERVEHVATLVHMLSDAGAKVIGLSGSVERKGRKVSRRPASSEARTDAIEGVRSGRYDILVSTPGMVGEGFDLPRIGVVYLAAPHAGATRTEQIAGRCTRPYQGKTEGVIVDYVDEMIEPWAAMARKRARVYARLEGES